jgi:hypothetical protein
MDRASEASMREAIRPVRKKSLAGWRIFWGGPARSVFGTFQSCEKFRSFGTCDFEINFGETNLDAGYSRRVSIWRWEWAMRG